MDLKSKKIMYYACVALFLLISAGSGAAMMIQWIDKKNNSSQMESLAAYVDAPALSGTSSAPVLPEVVKQLTREEQRAVRASRLKGCEKLHRQNDDMAGWIKIPGTKVNYPVMQSAERPDFYLNHDFNKKASSHGVPYIAESCNLEQVCNNLIIYGHHMKDGTMFAELINYTDRAFYEKNPVIQFDTLDSVGDYQIIAVAKGTALPEDAALFKLAGAENEQQYAAYVEEIKSRAFYDTGLTAVFGEPLLTLITCEYTIKEGRLLVVAKHIEE